MPQTAKRKEAIRQIVIRIKEVIRDMPDAEVMRRMAAAGEQTSTSTIRRLKAEGSEDTGFNYELTLRPYAKVFLGLNDEPVDVAALDTDTDKDRATLDNIITIKNLQLDALEAQCAALDDTLAREREKTRRELDHLTGQIRGQRQQMLVKDDQLTNLTKLLDERRDFIYDLQKEKAQLKRSVTLLSMLLALCLLIIISALIVDRLNSNIGFFWLEEAAAHIFGSTTTGEAASGLFSLAYEM